MLLERLSRLIRERRLPDVMFWWANRDLLWREVHPPRSGSWHVLCADPVIVYVMEFGREVESLARRLRARPTWLLVSNPWIPRSLTEAHALARRTAELGARYPRLSIVYLCNDADEAAALGAAGLQSRFCHQNALLDENLFRPKPGVPKTADAIYLAQLVAYKRHYLARDIQSLIVKTYLSGATRDRAYIQQALRDLWHARWVYRCSDEDVCELINSCRVGLCLSAAEGGMYASMEYMLCGLPVVTTPSVGGREVFWHGDHVLTVDPDPASVRLGVEAMIRRNLDPERVRNATLARLRPHRETFVDTVNSILVGAGRAPTYQWGDRFIHKMSKERPFRLVSGECLAASTVRREARGEGPEDCGPSSARKSSSAPRT
jgi:glycosyltransferase involved in cell wall biosynthesis